MAVRFQRRRRNGYKRPGYKACGKMVYGDAKKALLIARGVKRLLNVEIKNLDTQFTAQNISTSFTQTLLSDIPQGDTTNTRDGSQVKLTDVSVQFLIQANGSATNTSLRCLLVQDKQSNQAIFAMGDLLEDITVNDATISPRNLDNTHRFRVLWDKQVIVSDQAGPMKIVKTFKKLDMKIRYDGTSGAIADHTQNSLWICIVADEATNVPVVTLFARVRYVDN